MALVVTPAMTDVSMCEAVTGWSDLIEQFAVETGGVNIEGSGSLCGWVDLTLSAIEYYTITSADLTGQHVYIWMYCSGKVDTRVNGGFRIVLYTDASNYAEFYVGGNDTHFAQWNLLYCDPSSTDALVHETGTFDPTDVTRIGVRFKTLTNAIRKGQTYVQNCFWDAVRYGTGLTLTSGATDQVTLEDIFTEDMLDSSHVWGVVQKSAGAYVINGALILGGTGTESIDFISAGDVLLYPDNPLVSDVFKTIQVLGNATGTSDFDVRGSFIKASGQPGVLDLNGANLDDIDVVGNTLVSMASFLATGEVITTNVFSETEQIDAGGADLSGSVVKGYEGTVDTGALSWTPATDPNGLLDDMSFAKGTAATHAIEFGILSPLTMTLTGIDFSGYNAADGQTDSALLIRRTTGTVAIALVGCTGTIKYKSLGATVTLTASKSATFTPVENGAAFTITRDSDNLLLLDVPSVTGGEVIYSYDGALDDTAATVHIIIAGKEPIDFAWVVAEGTVPIAQVTDRVYDT